ncbi:sunset domain-containing protein [Levilactobacillus tujiorum]|uniref:DNA-entry nuclease n=1 Tax=Levilactobacillus tujiorum TaxID=2912243 RepID=A0ABX1L4E7_9LACO|nr:hypothetical protein [Levilactobacillus tujiorum]MCH5464238.1 hypothetical protein [Levilactobacillus tujiorum]NLR11328.1 hypothetical protein [Lactobacillus sp. HBUAS51387]NLR29219.1 hypothetical protein [Levilactobacillus tujiorum]
MILLIWLLACAGGGYWAYTHHRKWLVGLSVLLFVFGGIGALGSQQPASKTKTVNVGTQRLAKAQSESRQLAASSSRQDKAFAAVTSQIDESTSVSESKADSASTAAASSQAAAKSAAKATSRQASSATRTSRASHKQGNLDTDKAQQIVGNRNSKIYHVPGQAGYHMNSSNAVCFQTEAQAKAAGYRKALR